MKPKFKGLVLAAGHGSRMKPLTSKTPKPLLPFFNSNIIEFALNKIDSACNETFINCYHLKEKMVSYFDQHHPQRYTLYLENELLGTGGTIGNLKNSLKDDGLIIYNSDIFSDVNIDHVVSSHVSSGCLATMVLLDQANPNKTKLYCENNRIMSIGEEPIQQNVTSHMFTGIHILSNEFIKSIPEDRPFQIVDHYKSYLAKKAPINAYFYDGPWFDIGEPQDYYMAAKELVTSFKPLLDNTLNAIDNDGRSRFWPSNVDNKPMDSSVFVDNRGNFYFTNTKPNEESSDFKNCVILGDDAQIEQLKGQENRLIYSDQVLDF